MCLSPRRDAIIYGNLGMKSQKPEAHLNHILKIQSVPHKNILRLHSNRLMLFREAITVHYENHAEQMYRIQTRQVVQREASSCPCGTEKETLLNAGTGTKV
jgi:hypothetical protein